MNILYISNLSGASWAGPSFSIPRQIKAQSNYDNVFWYNCTNAEFDEWRELIFLHTLREFPAHSIYALREPFNKPDLIIVEQFYNYAKSPLLKELLSCNIPYIIIPRGELTKQAQSRKKLKKKIANLLLFKSFARNALAIQYLTEQEKNDSGRKWNKESLVIPNGIELHNKKRTNFSKDNLRCVFIGRIAPYHKGLDLLIEACGIIKEDLIESNCTINIYGPDNEKELKGLKKAAFDVGIDKIIQFHDGVYGKEKETILLNSDVFLMTSRFEGHPMALIEAMSYGLPCLVTTGSNMRLDVEKSGCGWTADCTVESIVSAMKKMLSEKELLVKKGNASLELSKVYNWDSIARMSHELYKKILFK